MKNKNLKLALEKAKKQKTSNFSKLGLDEIQTIKGGKVGEDNLSNGDCTSSNCQNTNCGWN